MDFGYEVDFLAVGQEGSSGDAIAMRFGYLKADPPQQAVVVIDGGHKDCGRQLVDHIRAYYGTNRADIVIASHSDNDHIAGLQTVIEDMEVGELWMHQPWKHPGGALSFSTHMALTKSAIPEPVTASIGRARDLETIAARKGIPIQEPLAGLSAGEGLIQIVGPTTEYYEELLPQVLSKEALATKAASMSALERVIEALKKMIPETWWIETLGEDGKTTPNNNTSAITLITLGDRRLLFTADAGIDALGHAADHLDGLGIVPGSYKLVQIPHHGSRRNSSPSVLDRLLGPTRGSDTKEYLACASAAKSAPKHPSRKVTNAFRRRGAHVFATQGTNLRFNYDAPDRAGWTSATAIPFFDEVEE